MANRYTAHLRQFMQEQAPGVYQQMDKSGDLTLWLWQSWLWIATERARAASEALSDTPLTDAKARRSLAQHAADCASEICLELLQAEILAMPTPDTQQTRASTQQRLA